MPLRINMSLINNLLCKWYSNVYTVDEVSKVKYILEYILEKYKGVSYVSV